VQRIFLICWVYALIAGNMAAATNPDSSGTPLPAKSIKKIGRLGETGHLPRGFEPSGAVWHKGRQSLITVSDEGQVAELNEQGQVLGLWSYAGDLEAVTVADHSSSLVYQRFQGWWKSHLGQWLRLIWFPAG